MIRKNDYRIIIAIIDKNCWLVIMASTLHFRLTFNIQPTAFNQNINNKSEWS